MDGLNCQVHTVLLVSQRPNSNQIAEQCVHLDCQVERASLELAEKVKTNQRVKSQNSKKFA